MTTGAQPVLLEKASSPYITSLQLSAPLDPESFGQVLKERKYRRDSLSDTDPSILYVGALLRGGARRNGGETFTDARGRYKHTTPALQKDRTLPRKLSILSPLECGCLWPNTLRAILTHLLHCIFLSIHWFSSRLLGSSQQFIYISGSDIFGSQPKRESRKKGKEKNEERNGDISVCLC